MDDETYLYTALAAIYFTFLITSYNNKMNKFNWKKLLLDIVKVLVGTAAGWFGAGNL